MRVAALWKSVVGVCMNLILAMSPGSPFIASRGDRDLHGLSSLSGRVTAPTLLKPVHLVLEGWSLLWRFAEPCGSHGGRIAGTAGRPDNSGKRPQIVIVINLPHSLSTVRQYATVKEVWAYSKKDVAAVPWVVGTVDTLPCRGMGVIASVTSWVRSSCGGSLAAQVSGARAWTGPGESELASEALRGRASRNLCPRPRGVGRVGTCVRGPEGSGESELAPEAPRGRASRNLRPRP